MAFKQGSFLTVDTTGHVVLQLPDMLDKGVRDYLASSGVVDVSRNDVGPTLLSRATMLANMIAGSGASFDYEARTTVRALYDYDTEADAIDQIVGLVQQAFSDVAGSDAVSRLHGSDTRNAPTPDAAAAGDNPLTWLRRSLGVDDLVHGVNDDVRLVLYGVLAIVALIVVLIAFGPNVPKLATIRL